MTKVKEIWKDIPGYEGIYQANNLGKIKRLPPRGKRVRKNTKNTNGLILKEAIHSTGYWAVSLSKMGKQRTFKIHRILALLFIPNPENKPQVNHKNGIKTDNRIENLEWVTNRENVIHSFTLPNRNRARGEKVYGSKIDSASVIAIRQAYGKYPTKSIASYFGVNVSTIRRAANRQLWKHI